MTIRLDEPHGGVWRNDNFIELTPFQFRVLGILLRAEGGYVNSDSLRVSLHCTPDAVHHHVLNLGKRLGKPQTIFNRRGWGYRLERDV